MLDELVAHDAAQLLIAAELAEEGNGGAAGGVLEIDAVAEVHGKSETVDHDEEPLAEALPEGTLLLRDGQQNQQHVEGIGIGDGRSVEIETSHDDAPPPIGTHEVLIGGVVLEEERQSRDAVYDIQQQQIEQ